MSLLFVDQDMLILHLKQLSSFWGVLYIEVKNDYIKFFLDSELLIVYEAMFLRGAFIMKQLIENLKERAKESRRNKHIKTLSKEQKQNVYFQVLEFQRHNTELLTIWPVMTLFIYGTP